MNTELKTALEILEKEKDISKETLLEAIENSLLTACKNHFGKADNVKVTINPETGDFTVMAAKTVVEEVEDPVTEISLVDAKMKNSKYDIGDIVNVEIKSKEFGRIATQNAKNVILQKIREEERKVLYNEYYSKEREVVTGIVQRYLGRNVSINLGKVDAILNESEQVKGETFQPTERVKVYILEVKDTPKGPRILLSRTHPGLVKRLFESEVAEVKDGTVEIKSIAREAGSRTKIAVWSNDPDVDAVGACVGMNGARVNAVIPPVSVDGPILTIRQFPKEAITMKTLLEKQSITKQVLSFLLPLVKARYTILIGGGTGAGKTTFLNALSAYIPKDERIITIEDNAELQIQGIPNLVRLECRMANIEDSQEITTADLLKTALRMRPDRIIVGEVRSEASELLQAVNVGSEGSLSTIHANSCADMVSRLETLVLIHLNMPITAIRRQIVSGFDLFIHLGRLRDKSRKVLEISELDGLKNGEVQLNPIFCYEEEQGLVFKNHLKHTEKLERAGISYETLLCETSL